MRNLRALFLVLPLVLLGAGSTSACPNCKEAVANQQGSDGATLREGYSWSIMMMIGMPFGLVTTGAFVVARAVKRGVLPEM